MALRDRTIQRILNTYGRQASMLMARHIGVHPVAIMTYAEGCPSLTPEQEGKLEKLVADYFNGNVARGGYYTDENGKTCWKSMFKEGE